jgi:thiol-disulfide isomerase/thioredoxin
MQDLDAQIAREIDVDGVFLATKREPNSKLFQNQLQLDDTGHICLLEHQCASIPGVFAVGTVADPCYGLAICAAGDGAKAALDVKKYLSSLRDHPFFLEPALEKPKKTAVIEILNLEHFYKELSTAQLPVIVDCHMTGCLYCEELTPFFEMWALRLAEKYTFLKVNLCDIPVLREKYEIGSTPTVLFFDQNQQLIDALERDTVYSFFSNL